jgi:hypothetical protein
MSGTSRLAEELAGIEAARVKKGMPPSLFVFLAEAEWRCAGAGLKRRDRARRQLQLKRQFSRVMRILGKRSREKLPPLSRDLATLRNQIREYYDPAEAVDDVTELVSLVERAWEHGDTDVISAHANDGVWIVFTYVAN